MAGSAAAAGTGDRGRDAPYDYVPRPGQYEGSNVHAFMRAHGIGSLDGLRARAAADPEWYWGAVAVDVGIRWSRPYERVLDASGGSAWPRWFPGGRTNIVTSSLDRFAAESPGAPAYRPESEEGGAGEVVTYGGLKEEVDAVAAALSAPPLSVGAGDAVAVCMPAVKEAVVAILAAARIGAVQATIFSGYGPGAVLQRVRGCGARALFVSDGYRRGGRDVSQAAAARRCSSACGEGGTIPPERIVVAEYGGTDRRAGGSPSYADVAGAGRDLIAGGVGRQEAVQVDSSHPLFALYTSGTTGRPKGAVHTHGAFSAFAGHQAAYLLDLRAGETLFWPADIGWITGLVWNVYGLLLTGAAAVLYDGAIDRPGPGRFWEIARRHDATVLGTSPTAVRMMRASGELDGEGGALAPPRARMIATTGEPIDEASWRWLFERGGGRRIPIANLAGGTEAGGALLSVLPGMPLRACTVGAPCPGIDADSLGEDGGSATGERGYLVVRGPWPGMTAGLLGDRDGYVRAYWSRFGGSVWFHGDYVERAADGLWYMRGRADDVVNVSGHRLGTAEMEQAAASHADVAEAAAVAVPDQTRGEAVVVFVVPRRGAARGAAAAGARRRVEDEIGRIAAPRAVVEMPGLPRTHTGKIVRRALRARLLGEDAGDLSTVENPGVLDAVPRGAVGGPCPG